MSKTQQVVRVSPTTKSGDVFLLAATMRRGTLRNGGPAKQPQRTSTQAKVWMPAIVRGVELAEADVAAGRRPTLYPPLPRRGPYPSDEEHPSPWYAPGGLSVSIAVPEGFSGRLADLARAIGVLVSPAPAPSIDDLAYSAVMRGVESLKAEWAGPWQPADPRRPV